MQLHSSNCVNAGSWHTPWLRAGTVVAGLPDSGSSPLSPALPIASDVGLSVE